MKLTLEQAKERMKRNGGNLDLRGTPITALPDNLTVGGSLCLSGTPITALPNNLTVGRCLCLSGTLITALPDNLTVGGSLDLRGTLITALPDNLTVGGSLCLSDGSITALPDNLTVGGWLDLRGTLITALPDNLTVGCGLCLSDTSITSTANITHLRNGDYAEGKYIYADNMLTHIKARRQVGTYTLYVGKIKNCHVVSDGEFYAHCRFLRDGIADIAFKRASARGADQYKGLALETELTVEEAKTMYRVITGACRAGTEAFVESLGELKEKYTIREMLEITRGQYNSERFAEFFEAE